MADSTYNEQIQRHWGTLVELVNERQKLDIRIGKLRELIKANANMLTSDRMRETVLKALESMNPPTGMADAVSKILMRHRGEGLTPTEIKDALIDSGYDLSEQSNPLASIATTLRRMTPDDAVEVNRRDGKRAYKYNWGMTPLPTTSGGSGIIDKDLIRRLLSPAKSEQ